MAASEDDVEFSVNANLAGLLASLQRAGELATKWADQMSAAAKAAKDAAEASASQMMKTHADLAKSYEQTASRAE
ncbi:hypothetical protein, partial [Zavarzinella formosa]|uniref:hypothetical protein n=1 Tax=Zavarzinella formosa TaxID=360055 RepID=UPI00187D9096